MGNKETIMKRIRIALHLNRRPISPVVIAKHFPDFMMGNVIEVLNPAKVSTYMNVFCSSYNRLTWQQMRKPTVSDLNMYLVDWCTNFRIFYTSKYTNLLMMCTTPDALYYLYQLTDTPFDFWDVLNHVTKYWQRNCFQAKHINWLIKLLVRGSNRIRTQYDCESYWNVIPKFNRITISGQKAKSVICSC